MKEEPCEITMYQFYGHLYETKRRDYFSNWMRIAEAANVMLFDYYKNKSVSFHYNLQEKIITDNKKENPMYDKSLINELSNIESHKNTSGFRGNMVHYAISGRSTEAVDDMTEVLIQRLEKAERISGRRMEIISEIEPNLYKVANNHLEEIIENNYGGVTVIDLSEKFGFDSVDYDYNTDELTDIFKMMIKDRGFTVTEDAVKEARNIFEKARIMDNFGNGRYVRNLIDRARQNQSIRLLAARESVENIRRKVLFMIVKDDSSILKEGINRDRKTGTARKELDEMTGLSSVKAIIYKAIAGFKLKKLCMDKGI